MPKKEWIKKVLVIGSGPIVIGQAAEFDYAGTQASANRILKLLKKLPIILKLIRTLFSEMEMLPTVSEIPLSEQKFPFSEKLPPVYP